MFLLANDQRQSNQFGYSTSRCMSTSTSWRPLVMYPRIQGKITHCSTISSNNSTSNNHHNEQPQNNNLKIHKQEDELRRRPHGWFSPTLCWAREARYKRMHTVWCCLRGFRIGKTNSWWQNSEYELPWGFPMGCYWLESGIGTFLGWW